MSSNIGKEALERIFYQKDSLTKKSQALSKLNNNNNTPTQMNKQSTLDFNERNLHNIPIIATDTLKESNFCGCLLCQERKQKKNDNDVEIIRPVKKEKNPYEKNFAYLLRTLVPDKGTAIKGLQLLIADTVIFQNGEPKYLIYNSRDKYLRVKKSKEALSLDEIKKFFQEKKKRKDLYGIGFYYETNISLRNNINQAQAEYEKNNKFKPNPMVFTTLEDQKKQGSRYKKADLQTSSRNQAAICHFKDESLQILSEFDFSYFMTKRKVDTIWKEMEYIQMYIRLKKEHPYYIKVSYDHEKQKNSEYYTKASSFVYFYSEERDVEAGFMHSSQEDYFEEELKNSNIHGFCQYLTCKLACYLEAFCNTRIKEMEAEFAWEETNLVYLVNANRILFQDLKYVDDFVLKDVEIVNEEAEANALNKIKTSPYEGKHQLMFAFKNFSDEYIKAKRDLNLEKELEDSIIETQETNQAFKTLNPEIPFTLHDVMSNTEDFEKFKQWLHSRSQGVDQKSLTYKSALRYAINKYEDEYAHSKPKLKRAQSATMNFKPISEIKTGPQNAFVKKLKALDICGNGFAKKKFITSSEVTYNTGVITSQKFQSMKKKSYNGTFIQTDPNTTSRSGYVTASTIPSMQEHKSRDMEYSKTSNQFEKITLKKPSSLASILYLKPK